MDPPRQVPTGLYLKLLAHRDVTGSLLFLLPAAAALVGAASSADRLNRLVLLTIGTILLYAGLKTALPALLRSLATLQRMRHGFATMGRIVSCHLAWDSGKAEMPYREFLENWVVNVGRSQMGKATGCFTRIFVTVFIAPLGLMILLGAIVLVANSLQVPGGQATAGDLDWQHLSTFAGMGLIFVVASFLVLRIFRRSTVNAVVPYMEWRRLMQPADNAIYDEDAMRLVAEAKERGVQISLKEPLPADNAGIELICKVEYSVMGEPCIASGRVRLSNRLDPTGVERILFLPLERQKIDFFAGLPDDVRTDEQGQWRELAPRLAAAMLVLTGLTAAVAIGAFVRIVAASNGLIG